LEPKNNPILEKKTTQKMKKIINLRKYNKRWMLPLPLSITKQYYQEGETFNVDYDEEGRLILKKDYEGDLIIQEVNCGNGKKYNGIILPDYLQKKISKHALLCTFTNEAIIIGILKRFNENH